MKCHEIRTSQASEPTVTPNETLVCCRLTQLSRRVIVIRSGGNGIDRDIRAVGCCHRSDVAGVLKEAFDKIGSKTRLVEMNRDQRRSDAPCEVNPKEPFNNIHKIHLTVLGQETTEERFDGRIFRKINKVIDIEAKCERGS